MQPIGGGERNGGSYSLLVCIEKVDGYLDDNVDGDDEQSVDFVLVLNRHYLSIDERFDT